MKTAKEIKGISSGHLVFSIDSMGGTVENKTGMIPGGQYSSFELPAF